MSDTPAPPPPPQYSAPPYQYPPPPRPQKPSFFGWGQDAATLRLQKIALIAALAFATTIPSYFISGLVAEREGRQEAVQKEFARNWGPQQSVYSPILIVPYQAAPDRPRQYLRIAPTRLQLVATLAPQERKRGLFHATVYDARIEMQGVFAVPDEHRLKEFVSDKESRFLWGESLIGFAATTSLAGLRGDDRIAVNGVDTTWQPCLEVVRYEPACRSAATVLARTQIDPSAPIPGSVSFKATASLRGTSAFKLLFGGKELDATIRSPWPTPSFGGDILPSTSTVTAKDFEAQWQTTEFSAPLVSASTTIIDPTTWKGPSVGVELIEATPIYRMITRVAKYGLLFVVLAFATYFFFELLSRLQIHVVQYGLLALSLSLFSLLLLSLAEPIGYTAGYLVSAGLVLIQSTLYTYAVAKRAKPALVFAGMLASLFAFLYVVLGLETYSLLIGTLALFAVVSVLMVLTQRVNWAAQPQAEGTVG